MYNLESILYDNFIYASSPVRYNGRIDVSESIMFLRSVKLENGDIECPTLLYKAAPTNIITVRPFYKYANEVLLNRKTFPTILKDCCKLNCADGFLHASKTGDLRYYGGKGFLVDMNFSPLYITTFIVDKNLEANHRIKKIRVLLHPKIFQEANTVNKGIRKHLISYYSTYKMYYKFNVEEEPIILNPDIIITPEIEKYVYIPKTPSIVNVNEELQNTLIDNLSIINDF